MTKTIFLCVRFTVCGITLELYVSIFEMTEERRFIKGIYKTSYRSYELFRSFTFNLLNFFMRFLIVSISFSNRSQRSIHIKTGCSAGSHGNIASVDGASPQSCIFLIFVSVFEQSPFPEFGLIPFAVPRKLGTMIISSGSS